MSIDRTRFMQRYRHGLALGALCLLAACDQQGYRPCSSEALRAGTCSEYTNPSGGDDRPINSYK
jgi:hypothetical protein